MSNPKHVSEVIHQLVLNNPKDRFAQILRHCPFIQIEMLRQGYISLNDLTDDEIDRLIEYDLQDINIEELRRKEAQQ